MKTIILSLLIVFTMVLSSMGQNLQVSHSSKKQTVNLAKYRDNWNVAVQSMEMMHPGGNSYNNFLQNQKKIVTNKFPRKGKSVKKRSFNQPTFLIENGFEGNLYNNKVPNDNTLAISNDDIIIAGINSSYIVYDLNNDSLLLRTTLNSITSPFTNLLFVKKYDPKFIYDQEEDRFIMVFLVYFSGINHVWIILRWFRSKKKLRLAHR